MVLMIKLDSEDGDQVRGLSEGAELLFNEINRPRSFQPMWVVDVLTGIQTIITSVNVRFDGNWLSVFIRLGPKGRKHMFISTETGKVKWRCRSCLLRCVNQTSNSQ